MQLGDFALDLGAGGDPGSARLGIERAAAGRGRAAAPAAPGFSAGPTPSTRRTQALCSGVWVDGIAAISWSAQTLVSADRGVRYFGSKRKCRASHALAD